MSRVYKAHDAILDRTVAIKITRTEAPEFAPLMLRREARILARLAPHPFIIPVYEAGAIEGRAFIAMEYLPYSLDSILFRYPKGLPIAHALAMGIDVGNALGHAHAQGVIHRDVKPGSVLFDEEQRSIRLSDFNLATMVDSESGTANSGPNGTPKYMAPEQREGLPLTPSADVYALGVTLRELLLGSDDDRLDRLPDVVSACVRQATAADPVDRFSDGRAFAQALRRATAPGFGAASLPREHAS
jgi:serine/threonine-protein kinase